VLSTTLRFPKTPVPTDETTYICQGFYLPNDTDYHVIGSTPFINNPVVMHHMVLYACKDIPGEAVETCDAGIAGSNIILIDLRGQ